MGLGTTGLQDDETSGLRETVLQSSGFEVSVARALVFLRRSQPIARLSQSRASVSRLSAALAQSSLLFQWRVGLLCHNGVEELIDKPWAYLL